MPDLVCSAAVDALMQGADVPEIQESISLFEQTPIVLLSPVTNAELVPNTLIDTGLQFSLVSGGVYRFSFGIPYDSAATGTGSRFVLDGPAFTSLNFRTVYPLAGTTQTVTNGGAYNIPAACNATSLTAGNWCMIDGSIIPSADGDLKVRFASEVSLSGITVLAGASGIRYRFA
jgi:hypothetical protein